VNQAKTDTPPEVHAEGFYVDRGCRRGLLTFNDHELIDLTTMQPFKVVLGWPVTPIPASLIPAGTPASLAIATRKRSFCAAAIQSLACLLTVKSPLCPRKADIESRHGGRVQQDGHPRGNDWRTI
jgi:hypothetical protein